MKGKTKIVKKRKKARMRTHKFAQKSGTTTSLATFTERKRRNKVSSVLGVGFVGG